MNELAYVLVVVGATAFLQAITGFGFALLSVPILSLRLPVHEAVVLSACVGTVSSGWQSVHLRRFADATMARRYIMSSMIGVPFGYLAFVLLSDRMLRIVVGVAVLGGTLIVAVLGNVRVSTRAQRLLGVLSGGLLIATSTNGPPIVLAMQAQRMPKQEFRGTLARIFFVSGVVSVILFAFAGRLNGNLAIAILSCLPLLWAAIWLGNKTALRVREDVFRYAVLALLLGAGLSSLTAVLV